MHNTTNRINRIWVLLLFLILAVNTASADVSIVNDVNFNLDNSAFIKVLAPQNSTSITLYNSTDTPASTLQYSINGSIVRFTANTNKTLSNISYNSVLDVLAYTGNGTTGYLNVTARMRSALAFYDFKVDGNTSQVLLSNSSGWIVVNYTGWTQNQHKFEISAIPPSPPPPPPPTPTPTPTPTPKPAAPNIISWSNSKTNNDSLTLTINTTEAVRFNATANQTIDIWNWFKDDVNQDNNFDDFTTTLTAGIHTIKVNATNSNGASNTITWTVTVRAVVVAPNINAWSNSKTNNGSLTLAINTTEAVRFNAAANQTIDTWNWFKDNVSQINNFDNFNTSFTSSGTHTVKVNATNTNGTSNTITWTVTVSGVPGAPGITSFAPPSPVSDVAGAARTFSITTNQTVNVTWYINGTTVFNQTSVTESSYTNTSASTGTWNVTAAANNSNGAVSQQWIWNVTAVKTIIINITSPANNSVNDTGIVNVTVTLDIPGTALLNWEGANESMNGAGTDFYKNKTGLLSGNYTFKVYANDSGGISNVSETRAVIVNRTIVDNTIGSFINTSTFVVNTTLEIAAPSGNVTVAVPSGTNASIGGVALTSISVDSLAKVDSELVANLPGSSKLIGENLSLGPDGARFSPDIQVRFNYTDSQVTALGITESDLTVKFYNTTTNSWETLAIFDRNTINDYLIANISHFTTFALIGTTAVPVPPPAPPAPVSVPGGGGAGVISPEPFHNIDMFEIMEDYLLANVPTSYILTAQDIVISEVLITPANNFGLTSIRVEMLKDLSKIEGIKPPLGIVYKYANIWAGAKELEGEEGIIDAFIGFKVETGWLAENNLEKDVIKLLRWDGSKWVTLETTAKSRDEQFVYYEAKTPGFSPFAIVAVPFYPSVTVGAVETSTIDTAIQKIIKQIGEPGLSRWVYIFIALVLGGLLVYSLIKIKNAIKANQTIAGVLKSDSLIKIKKAMRFSDEAEKIKPEDETTCNKGIALYESGDYEEAIKAYDKAIEINPEYADAWYNKGFALYELGNYEDALKAYDKAREIIRTSRHRD